MAFFGQELRYGVDAWCRLSYLQPQKAECGMKAMSGRNNRSTLFAVASKGSIEGKPTAARDVPAGQSWIFPDHPSMAVVIAAERRAREPSVPLADNQAVSISRICQSPL